MQTVPARIVVQLFTKRVITSTQYESLSEEIAGILASQGRRLVDLVVDNGPAKNHPAEHTNLMRIAEGEADGIALFSLPMRITPKNTADVLEKHLTGPFVVLTAAELADRGLLPGGTHYSSRPGHVRTAAPGSMPDETPPQWQAAQREAELRDKHASLSTIGKRPHAEGFRPPSRDSGMPQQIANLPRNCDRSLRIRQRRASSTPSKKIAGTGTLDLTAHDIVRTTKSR